MMSAPSENGRVHRCLLCGSGDVDATRDGRFVTTECRSCSAILRIEFNPPDDPEVRARVERIDEGG